MKKLESLRFVTSAFDQFLVPSRDGWWEAGKALQRLSQKLKRDNFGSTPKISPEERVRLFNDCLLAVPCRRAGVVVVTDNTKDFERLSSVCRAKFQGGDEFLHLRHENLAPPTSGVWSSRFCGFGCSRMSACAG